MSLVGEGGEVLGERNPKLRRYGLSVDDLVFEFLLQTLHPFGRQLDAVVEIFDKLLGINGHGVWLVAVRLLPERVSLTQAEEIQVLTLRQSQRETMAALSAEELSFEVVIVTTFTDSDSVVGASNVLHPVE